MNQVDAVNIVTPTPDHFSSAKKALDKDCHLFVEKPITDSVEQAEKIIQLAKEKNKILQVGHIERFNPAVSELKKILEAKSVINIDFFRTNRLSNRITDVDVVLDLMIHDIDMALYLNGPVQHIEAFGSKEDGLIAFCTSLLQHTNGSISRLVASRMTEKKMRSIQVTAADCYIDVDLLRRDLLLHQQSWISRDTEKAYVISSKNEQVEVKPREALVEELKAFIAGCNGNVKCDVPGLAAGVEAQRVSSLVLERVEDA